MEQSIDWLLENIIERLFVHKIIISRSPRCVNESITFVLLPINIFPSQPTTHLSPTSYFIIFIFDSNKIVL